MQAVTALDFASAPKIQHSQKHWKDLQIEEDFSEDNDLEEAPRERHQRKKQRPEAFAPRPSSGCEPAGGTSSMEE